MRNFNVDSGWRMARDPSQFDDVNTVAAGGQMCTVQ